MEDKAFWQAFLKTLERELKRYKSLGDRTFDQLNHEELLSRKSDNDNSIALIVKHISGNITSRFTEFLTTDGEKAWRKRDNEFTDPFDTKDALLHSWEVSMELLFHTLNSLKSESWDRVVYIRNEPHTLTEALLRQLAHLASHVGQIVILGKQLKGEDWKNLSIPKGDSETFNAQYFKKEKDKGPRQK